MITIKTKQKTLVNPITQLEEYVYLKVSSVYFNGNEYIADVEYFYNSEDRHVQIQNIASKFTVIEADYLESNLDIAGDTVSEKLTDLIAKTTLYQVGVSGVFGLTSEDWEIVQ